MAKADVFLNLHVTKSDDVKSKKDGKLKDKTSKSGKTAGEI